MAPPIPAEEREMKVLVEITITEVEVSCCGAPMNKAPPKLARAEEKVLLEICAVVGRGKKKEHTKMK
jgi:hypothetical protein